MAQIVEIPFLFDFRLSRLRWAPAHARITGWWKRDDGNVDSDNLVAEIEGNPAKKELIRFPLHDLPEKEWDACIEIPVDENYDDEIELTCSDFQPQLLLTERSRYLVDSELKKLPPGDAWQMRDDFLRVESSVASAITFLEKWGRWSAGRWVALKEILSMQAAVRKALISSPGKWFTMPFSALGLWRKRPEYPFFMLWTDECSTAISMTVTIDLLQRIPFKRCARRDCGHPFAIRSKHKRKYCSQYCGHLESVRRNRKTS